MRWSASAAPIRCARPMPELEQRGRAHGRTGRCQPRSARADRHRESIERQLKHETLHDSLTGLPNRALFLERLSWRWTLPCRAAPAVRRAVPRPGPLPRHQRFGRPPAGDDLLYEVGGRISACLRRDDVVARPVATNSLSCCTTSAAPSAPAFRPARDRIAEYAPIAFGAARCLPPPRSASPVVAPPRCEECCATPTWPCTAPSRKRHRFRPVRRTPAPGGARLLEVENDLKRAVGRGELELISNRSCACPTGASSVSRRWCAGATPERGVRCCRAIFFGVAERADRPSRLAHVRFRSAPWRRR